MTIKTLLPVAVLAVLLTGCATQQQIETVNHRLDALEAHQNSKAAETSTTKPATNDGYYESWDAMHDFPRYNSPGAASRATEHNP